MRLIATVLAVLVTATGAISDEPKKQATPRREALPSVASPEPSLFRREPLNLTGGDPTGLPSFLAPAAPAALPQRLDLGAASPFLPSPLGATSAVPVRRAPVGEQLAVAPRDVVAARVNGSPIFKWEVVQAVFMRLPEWGFQGESAGLKKTIYRQELRKLIERELIVNEIPGLMRKKFDRKDALFGFRCNAVEEADRYIGEILKRTGMRSEDELQSQLRQQSLSLTGLRRHAERGYMMTACLSEVIRPKIAIGDAEMKKYYDAHPKDFTVAESVKWQDLFIRTDRFCDADDAKKYAEWLRDSLKKNDIAELLKYDQGTSKDTQGFGYGEKRGEINPPDLEPILFAMKAGEVKVVDFGSGFHIVRIAERTDAGQRPFADAEVQHQIRERLKSEKYEREYRKFVDSLWQKSKSAIVIDGGPLDAQPEERVLSLIER